MPKEQKQLRILNGSNKHVDRRKENQQLPPIPRLEVADQVIPPGKTMFP